MRKFLLLCSALVIGCTTADEAPDVSVQSGLSPKIIKGTASTDAQDAAVMLFWLNPATGSLGGLCTATMVAPNLAMTARHCVSVVADEDAGVACDSSGTPLIGGMVTSNHDPQDLYVFTGVNRPAFAGDAPPALDTTKWQPAGRGKQVIDDGATTLCNHDIAFVLLENPITTVPIASMQLDGAPTTNEKLTIVGWGVTTAEAEPATREQRTGVLVERDGPSDLDPTLTPSEFLFGESICSGDSGGPIYAQATGAILGVVSRGSNGNSPSSDDPAATCTNAQNLGTKLAPFKSFITSTFATAAATPKVTAPPSDDASGCAAAGSSPASSWLVGVALILVRRRRRASAS